MRQNLPVSPNEYILNSGMPIVSTTDLHGEIIYANPYFIEVSGYSREELLGSPHNIERHPDMPAAVFAAMWASIQAGQPWSGMLKNRRKSGDCYWVLANVTPLIELGKPVGYMSVRTRPSREQVAAAERAYNALRAEEAAATPALQGHRTAPRRGRVRAQRAGAA